MCANCKVKKENGTVSPSGEAQEGSQDEQLTPEKVSHNFILYFLVKKRCGKFLNSNNFVQLQPV